MVEEPIQEQYSQQTDIYTRLNEIEEKQRLLKDRSILIGENLISTKEEFKKLELNIKKELKELQDDLNSIKLLSKRMINEMSNFAKKSEFENLKHQAEIFEPLKFARIKDVEEIVKNKIEKTIKNQNSK